MNQEERREAGFQAEEQPSDTLTSAEAEGWMCPKGKAGLAPLLQGQLRLAQAFGLDSDLLGFWFGTLTMEQKGGMRELG